MHSEQIPEDMTLGTIKQYFNDFEGRTFKVETEDRRQIKIGLKRNVAPETISHGTQIVSLARHAHTVVVDGLPINDGREVFVLFNLDIDNFVFLWEDSIRGGPVRLSSKRITKLVPVR